MNTLHLMVGIQGSGKSTLAKKLAEELHIIVVSTDEIRQKFPSLASSMVLPKAYEFCAEELVKGNDVIYDATNITPKVRKRIIDAIKQYNINFLVGCHYLQTSIETCKKRVALRNQDENQLFLPLEVIDSYANNLIAPSEDEKYDFICVYDESGSLIKKI